MQHRNKLEDEAILRAGEVVEVNGRTVYIAVDKGKNLTDLVFHGNILRNISVNSFVEIRKGFLSLIGKVDGEKVNEDSSGNETNGYKQRDNNKRVLTVTLSGYINKQGRFISGMKEMPLIGNETYLLTPQKLAAVHNITQDKDLSINIAKTDFDDYEIAIPIDGVFNSHIAIFGNTGSGKSNTLASLYKGLTEKLKARSLARYCENTRFVLFDFNGEYIGDQCITNEKIVINLSTNTGASILPHNKIPIPHDCLLDLEVLSILADATEKTQRPFINRALKFFKKALAKADIEDYIKNILKDRARKTLMMSDKPRAQQILDYFTNILPEEDSFGLPIDAQSGLMWHNKCQEFYIEHSSLGTTFLRSNPSGIEKTELLSVIDEYIFPDDIISGLIHFLYIQLIYDLHANRAQNEHVAPAINKLAGRKADIDKIFDTTETRSFWDFNFVVVNLNNVNLEMKKTLPLLLSKYLYKEHKTENGKSLNIIIDEAHNILSRESFRESESWKDYRLETFEEIIKEGRKFGVFITISSQRPSDISPTITSQAHNYFIHRLINQKDLSMISAVVSYIDKVTEESIPVLPTGTCIFSGVVCPIPLKLLIDELPDDNQPKSKTIAFGDVVPDEAKIFGALS